MNPHAIESAHCRCCGAINPDSEEGVTDCCSAELIPDIEAIGSTAIPFRCLRCIH